MSNETFGQNYSRFKKYYLDLRRLSGRAAVQQPLTVVLSLFLIAFFVAFAIRPTFSKIAELRVKIDASEQTLESLQQKSASLSRAASLWTSVQDLLPALNASVPVTPFYRTFVKEVEVLAVRHNLRYLNSTFRDALIASQIATPYRLDRALSAQVVPFSFRLSGEYGALRSFLDDFRSIDRVVELDNVSILRDTASAATGGQGLVLTITGNVYYFGEEEALAPLFTEKR